MKNEQTKKSKPEELNKTAIPVAGAPEILQSEEVGGPKGLEPTRYGDWERNGRVSDF